MVLNFTHSNSFWNPICYLQHAKRLYPLQISSKAQVEWGYRNAENTWVVVDKSVLESVPDVGIEKNMGFEGTPDPTTGFYCVRCGNNQSLTILFLFEHLTKCFLLICML